MIRTVANVPTNDVRTRRLISSSGRSAAASRYRILNRAGNDQIDERSSWGSAGKGLMLIGAS
jgi:hypothetical protein